LLGNVEPVEGFVWFVPAVGCAFDDRVPLLEVLPNPVVELAPVPREP
jgi:hypothetical protein